LSTHTLYAFPFSCSFAVHLALVQHEIPTTLRWVQRGPRRQVEGEEFARLNPKRKVPTLILPSGEVLTEIVGVLLYLDERRHPERAPAERRRLIEWLAFTATELHKTVLAPAYDPAVSAEAREDAQLRLLPTVLEPLEVALGDRETLLGGPVPSAADAYLIWGLLLLRNLWPEAAQTPALVAYRRRMLAKPSVAQVIDLEQAAMAALA
jgi:glutathione S-transferase